MIKIFWDSLEMTFDMRSTNLITIDGVDIESFKFDELNVEFRKLIFDSFAQELKSSKPLEIIYKNISNMVKEYDLSIYCDSTGHKFNTVMNQFLSILILGDRVGMNLRKVILEGLTKEEY